MKDQLCWCRPRLQAIPSFSRTIKFRATDFMLMDVPITADSGLIVRKLKEEFGFTSVWNGSYLNFIECWIDNVRYISPISQKFNRFCDQVDAFIPEYMEYLRDYSPSKFNQLKKINTLAEKFVFYRDLVHGSECTCKP